MSDNPYKHVKHDPEELKPSGRVFHAPPESEEDRKAALTQELVRDLHQQLMAAIAERDAALNQGVAVGGGFCGFVKCTLVIEQPDFSEGVAGGAWLEPERDLVLASDLDAAYAERNEAIAERDAARKDAAKWMAAWARLADTDRVPADGGDGILKPSTASLSAAVSVPKLGER